MGFRVCDFEHQAVTWQEVSVWCSVSSYGLNLIKLYKEHGEGFVGLAGEDVSFVLYDPKKNLVVALRDFFGASPLFYSLSFSQENAADLSRRPFVSNQLFSFSLRSIIEQQDFVPEIDYSRIADYIDPYRLADPVNDQTFFLNVKKLLPGEALIIKDGSPQWKFVGRLDLEKYTGLTDEEYIGKFRTLFMGSVARKTKNYRFVGANLSGGLDSSSVCCVAAREVSVHTFYINTDTEHADERKYVNNVVEGWAKGYKPVIHSVVDAGRKIGNEMKGIIGQTAQPEMMVLPSGIFKRLIETAAEQEVEVILSGHGGDQIVGYGFEYLDELFEAESWNELSSAMNLSMKYYSANYSFLSATWENLDTEARARHYAIIFFARKWKKDGKRLKALFNYLWVLKKHFCVKPDEIYAVLKTGKKKGMKIPMAAGLIKTSFKDAITRPKVKSFDVKTLVNNYPISRLQELHLQNCFTEMGVVHNEELDVLFTEKSIKTAYPFLDKELLELTLQVPLVLRFDSGRGRGILRQALKDYLPAEVLDRTDKGEFSEFGLLTFQSMWEEFKQRPDAFTHKVWDIVDRKAFEENIRVVYDEKYQTRKKTTHILLASRVIYLAMWFDYLDKMAVKTKNKLAVAAA